MITGYGKWLVRWRYWVVLGVMALMGLAAAGAQHLAFKNDYRMFFDEDDPQLLAFEGLQATYAKNDNVLFVVAPEDGQVFSRAALVAVEQLTDAAWQIPYSSRVDSLTNFQHSHARGDELVVEDLVSDAARLDAAEVAEIRQTALAEPLLVNRLVSPAGEVTGVNVTVQLPGLDEAREVPEVAAAARELATTIEDQHSGIEVHVTGLVMMNAAFPEASERDLKTLIPLMLLVVIVGIGVMMREFTATAATLILILLAITGAMGVAGWLGLVLSPTSAAAPNIILTLAVAYCVHILASYYHALGEGRDQGEAMVESLRVNLQPLFLAALTTALGFLSLNFSEAPPFRDLGNITAIGVGIAFVLAVLLLPALMTLVPMRGRRRTAVTHRFMEALGDWVVRRRTVIFWGSLSVAGALILFVPRNELNDEYIKYFDETVEFRQATDFATDHLTGIYYIDYSLSAGAPDGVTDPAFLAKVEAFAEWFRQQPGVMHVFSVTDILKRLNRNLHGDDPSWNQLPERRELAAQYLLLYEMSLPYGLDLNDRINVDKSALRLTVTLQSLSSNEVLGLEDRAAAWLAAHAPPSMQEPGSGPTVMFAHIGQSNIKSMLLGVAVAMALISLVLIFALRSLKLGLLSLVPNLLPVLMGFGIWGLVVGQVGLALSVVAAMTLGIVVDDTVHFLSKYLRARREKDLSPEAAVRYALVTVGTPIWVTSVVLILGFSVLAFSNFEINSGMGLLTAIVILLALLADLLFLPTLVLKIEEKRHATRTTDVPVPSLDAS